MTVAHTLKSSVPQGPSRALEPGGWQHLKASLAALAWSCAGIAIFIGLWQLASIQMGNAVLLPPPLEVLTSFAAVLQTGALLRDLAVSLQRVFLGFLIAAAVAVPLALFLAYSRIARLLVMPIVTFLRPIPPIAWIPLAILWFGIGNAPSYFITAIAAFFPIFINAFSGGVSVRPEHIHAARCLGARRGALVRRIYLPSAMPMIATGLRIGLGQSWMAVVTAELVAAQSGLGYMIQIYRLSLDTAVVFVGMATIGLMGSVMANGIEVLERRVLVPWR